LNQNTNGNAIYFGRYNGSSPVAGELKKIKDDGIFSINTNKVNQLKEQLLQIEIDSNRVAQYIQHTGKTGSEAKDLKSFFQRLDGAEMRSRFDMQVAPPDIMITNYSMLSIMLMRDIDKGIFDETKVWLEESENNIFHLIIDELHLYRGTQGTEVAYLLKLVLNRLGLCPQHPQLRILASSASLEAGDEASKNFVCDFFGVSHEYFNQKFKIIEGKNNPITPFPENGTKLPIKPFKEIAEMFSEVKGNIEDTNFISTCEESARQLATTFSLTQDGNGISKLLSVITNPSFQLKERLFSPCQDYKAVCSIQANGDETNGKYFAETIFEPTDSKKELENALRGLFIARSTLDDKGFEYIAKTIPDNRKLPRFRFHYFFRNIEGVWASVKADDVDVNYIDNERTAGKLYSTTRINSEKGNRVLELLYCDNCGTTLFGGSRLVTRNESGNNSFEMLPISPNIEGIPEKTPAKLVERRSYQEYAVFWPCGNQQYTSHDAAQGISQNYWRQPTLNGFNQGDFEANWIPASLNCISGDIDFSHTKANEIPTQWIKGYYFTITNLTTRDIAFDIFNSNSIVETHKALPSVCPSCGINHQKRQQRFDKIKTSSIRGFRTGFAKTTQMFAKELMYQLPSNEDGRKLVVFSDSREDAAQIANGIERNHFTDLMREILVKELHSNLMFRFQIVNAFDNGNTTKEEELKEQSQAIFDEIEYLVENSNYAGTNANRLREKEIAISKLVEIRSLTLNVRNLVHITNTLNLAPIIKHFINLGINPGGNDISLQTKLLNGNFVPWYELIDFTNFQWANGANQEYIDELKEGSFNGLASIFFGSLFYSFESSALGYICINPELPIISEQARSIALAKDDFLQIVNSTIRILGDKYKHNKVDDDNIPFNPPIIGYSNFPEQVKKYIRAIANRFSKQENEIGEAVYNTLSISTLLRGDSGIQIENLFIKVARQTDSIWTSQRGSRPHLHFSGGICTYSCTALHQQPDKICDDIWKENYLSYNAIKQQRPPIRLHCEELTGQTDDQFERQRHFRNIILPDEGNKQVKTIDLLSVTTTLEVGVDIGALQAVMLGNMPPQRFNYQQRVGRAGRRGQAYSVILTFCRGRSHDEFYFANPQKITGDAPPTPFLSMGQERIFKRLLAKEILRRVYTEREIDITSDDKSSVHGEFGSVDSWATYKPEIINWINENRITIEQTVCTLITNQLQYKKDEFVNWVTDTTNGLIEKAEIIINNEEIASNDISEKFAEGGILPMFGMPTTVKNLYHGINRKPEPLSIDRAQAMAIYEFAPGAQKTKDKAIHQVIGFTSDFIKTRRNGFETITNVDTANLLPFSLNRWFVRCRACGFFETYSEERKEELENQNQFDVCPNCGEDNPNKYQPPFKLKSPRAYRTNLSAGSDTKDDSEFLLSRPPIFAEKIGSASVETINNASISISDNDVTWRVNTNSDRFFTGRLYKTNNCFPFNANGYWFNNQWLLNDFATSVPDENGYSMNIQQIATSADEQIALASNKNTEIFRIAPTSVPFELDLNMFFSDTDVSHVKARSNGVRSGYYSAAFLLQRILADKLDIDPTEIEIADISMKVLEDRTNRRIAEIILTDELPNGSGFVRYLYNNLTNILSESINPSNPNSYVGKIHSQSHQEKCYDACYDCLKVFRNMNYHSLLDWRLGLSMLRVMNDSTFVCGADGNFNYIELKDWLDFASKLRDSFFISFYSNSNSAERAAINGLPIIKFGNRQRNIIMIVHPFWNMRNFTEANWLTEIYNEINEQTESNGGKISIIDTFNLHRRPGWCYEKLIER
jgi:Lhr-like helicase